MSRKIGTVAATVVIFMVLLALAAGIAGAAEPAATLRLELESRTLVGDSDTFRFREGEEISILWISDEAVELHLHGYDLTVPAAPGAPGEMRFTGSSTGRFPVTSHGSAGGESGEHHTLIYIEIYPE